MGFLTRMFALAVVCKACYAGDVLEVEDLKNVIGEEERRGAETVPSLDAVPLVKDGKSAKRGIYLNKNGLSGSSLGHGHSSYGSTAHSFYGTGGKNNYPTGLGDLGHSLPSNAAYGATNGGYLPPTGSSGHGISGHVPTGPGHEYLPPQGHGHPPYGLGGHNNPLAWKGFLIPLAGIALLGAAAALSTNPVLLQLGVLNGKRRRRNILDLDANIRRDMLPQNPYVKPITIKDDLQTNN